MEIELLKSSFKAQIEYVARRMYNKQDKDDFIWTANTILLGMKYLSTPKEMYKLLNNYQEYTEKQIVLDIYNETYNNLVVRFELGRSSSETIERIL